MALSARTAIAYKFLCATRIELRDAAAACHLRGPIAALDTARQSLRIGSLGFDYGGALNRPASLAVGDIVRVTVRQVVGPFGGWVITAFGSGVRTPDDRDEAELDGRVGSFVSATQFSVNGLRVDGSAARFPEGRAGLGEGARVEVRGAMRGGVLKASELRIESDDELKHRFALRGTIEAVEPAARTFRLRGTTVSWVRDLRLDDGTLADIRVGRSVEVEAQLAANRSGREATRIKFK